MDQQGNKTCADCAETMLTNANQETGKEITLETQEKTPEPKYKPCQFCQQPKPENQLKPRHIKNLPNKDYREIRQRPAGDRPGENVSGKKVKRDFELRHLRLKPVIFCSRFKKN